MKVEYIIYTQHLLHIIYLYAMNQPGDSGLPKMVGTAVIALFITRESRGPTLFHL